MSLQDGMAELRTITRDEFDTKIRPQGLSEERRDLLFRYIQGQVKVSLDTKHSLDCYALKCLLPDYYAGLFPDFLPDPFHSLYPYDPAKNGQNLIKHGLGLLEATSYNQNFGVLTFPFPHETDGWRSVIFSDLTLQEGETLELPPTGLTSRNYVVLVATNMTDGRYRYISARFLSSDKKKSEETILQLLSEACPDKTSRKALLKDCLGILEANLFSNGGSQPKSPPTLLDAMSDGECVGEEA